MDKRRTAKQEFTEIEMEEILNNALPKNYHKELTSKQWDIYEHLFQKTVDRLKAAEPAIKQAAATAKSFTDLNMKSNDGGNAKKHNHDDNKKVLGDKKQCPHCHKKQAGVCWSKNGRRGGANGNQPPSFSKKQNQHIKSMITQATKKSRKSTDSDSDSDGDNTVEWTKGLTTFQQIMYISQEYKRNMVTNLTTM